MGYRSDVAYTIRFTDENSYRLFIMEAKVKDLGGCFSDDASHYEEAECDDARWRIDFSHNAVKWYDSYPDVIKHNQLIALAEEWCEGDAHRQIKDGVEGNDEVGYRIGFAFVRVGEDADDNEERHGGNGQYDWLYISRQIVTG